MLAEKLSVSCRKKVIVVNKWGLCKRKERAKGDGTDICVHDAFGDGSHDVRVVLINLL